MHSTLILTQKHKPKFRNIASNSTFWNIVIQQGDLALSEVPTFHNFSDIRKRDQRTRKKTWQASAAPEFQHRFATHKRRIRPQPLREENGTRPHVESIRFGCILKMQRVGDTSFSQVCGVKTVSTRLDSGTHTH